jgi:type 1 fimbriae regulatory protein FimB/type 1 fimbriae regulatory protein FimE
MVFLTFRHGLRAGEIVDLRCQIDFKSAALHVRRLKSGTPSSHP